MFALPLNPLAVLQPLHHQADGVICGHIHTAALHDDYGLRYINCGDWVESCTAVAEGHDGTFEIITWTQAGEDAAPALRLAQKAA